MMADLTSRNKFLKYASYQIQQEGSIVNKYIKFAYADANCSFMVLTNTGSFQKFSEAELNAIALYVDNTSRTSEGIYVKIGKKFESLHPGE